jgi:hypothetical protein
MKQSLLKISFCTIGLFSCLPSWSSEISEEKKVCISTAPVNIFLAQSDVFDCSGNDATSCQNSDCDEYSVYEFTEGDETLSRNDQIGPKIFLKASQESTTKKTSPSKKQLLEYICFLEAESDKHYLDIQKHVDAYTQLQEDFLLGISRERTLMTQIQKLNKENNHLKNEIKKEIKDSSFSDF